MAADHSTIFQGLNEQQRKAASALKGPLLIIAGAGSGKTKTITHRIAHLIATGTPAWQILAVTFTNKAAKELTERIRRMLELPDDRRQEFVLAEHETKPSSVPLSGTFHAIAVRMLRQDIEAIGRARDFAIYDTDDQEKVLQEVLREMQIAPEELKPRTARSLLSRLKSKAITAREAKAQADGGGEAQIADVYARYQHLLKESNALDFDDLILEAVRLLKECPDVLKKYQSRWKYLHVDEFQDTNRSQCELMSLLASSHRNLCVIGDPDQSIYAFRGADIKNILDFRKEYPDALAITLDRNYRSSASILEAAGGVIAKNRLRPEKTMWTERTDGAKVSIVEVMNERDEADRAMKAILERRRAGTSLSEQAILYRTNAQSRQFEEACLRTGIPYTIVGGVKFYARKEVKDALAYLSVFLNPADAVSLLRIINVPARKIGETTILRLRNFCAERGIPLGQALMHAAMIEGLGDAVKKRLSDFAIFIEEGRKKSEVVAVQELLEWTLKKIGMEQWLCDGTDEGESRWENVLELLSVAAKFSSLPPKASLQNFLQEVALVSDVDRLGENSRESLTLMTLHLCKGLEFSSVTIAGCEEGLLPHGSSLQQENELEEERRLLYVGMTRAKDTLTLSHAMSRTMWGNQQSNAPSRFLDDIPESAIAIEQTATTSRYGWLLDEFSGESAFRSPRAPRDRSTGTPSFRRST